MFRKGLLLFAVLFLIPSFALSETIDVHIKGIDDGIKTNKQQDYKEAVLFAKREAIERAGAKVKALTTVKDLVVNSDYIESEAEAVLLPGYNILDMGYSADGTYQIVLIGKVKTVSKQTEGIDSKDLRYAKGLVEKGQKSKGQKIISDIIKNSKDSEVVAEAMHYQILWGFAPNEIDTFEKLKAYYPNSKYVSRTEVFLQKKIKERRKIEAEIGAIIAVDGRFIRSDKGVVLDTKSGLRWYVGPDRATNWSEAKRWIEGLKIAGGGWRMPSRKELRTLYKEGAGTRNMTHLMNTTGWQVWSGETKGSSSAWYFVFGFGGDEVLYDLSGTKSTRSFAVRYQKKDKLLK